MKPILRKTILLSIFLFLTSADAEESYSFGLGMGTSYSGLGVNISQRSESDMKYLSAGCVGYSSIFGSACGAGVGWIRTDLFETNSNKHGFGAYLGVVGSKSKFRGVSYDKKAKYGVGIGYHYFFSGISESGANIGLTLVSDNAALLQWGYQF